MAYRAKESSSRVTAGAGIPQAMYVFTTNSGKYPFRLPFQVLFFLVLFSFPLLYYNPLVIIVDISSKLC